MARSKSTGYIAYPVDYSEQQTGDPGAELIEGDIVPGYLITKKVRPYITSSGIKTTCTVPIFGEFPDPIRRDLEVRKAIKRAGKILFSEEVLEDEDYTSIPNRCLIIN